MAPATVATLWVKLLQVDARSVKTLSKLQFRGAIPPLPLQGSAKTNYINEAPQHGIFVAVYQGDEIRDIGRLSFLEGPPVSKRKKEVLEDSDTKGEVLEGASTIDKKKEVEEKEEEEEEKNERVNMIGKKLELNEGAQTLQIKLWPGISYAALAMYYRGIWKATKAYRIHWLRNSDIQQWLASRGIHDCTSENSIFTNWRVDVEFEGPLLCTSSCLGLDVNLIDFRIGSSLGNGASGEVFKCEYKNGQYALKIMKLSHYFDGEPSETSVMSSFHDDSIVTFYQAWYDVYERKGIFGATMIPYVFIQMEQMESTLADFIKNGNEKTNDEEKWRLVEKIANIVKYVHGCGVIHRDLKPANLFLGRDGSLKLSDFGHSCWSDCGAKGSPHLGTMFYRAPELTNLDEISTNKVDIYSIGAIYLEIFVPYKERFNSMNGLRKGMYSPTWPVDLDFLQKLTALHPGDRPTIDEVLEIICSKVITDGGEREQAEGKLINKEKNNSSAKTDGEEKKAEARSKVQAFLEAARAGDLQSLKSLAAALDEDGTGAASVATTVRDANKRTPLHFAASEGRTDVCEFLIGELGLPVDPKDDDGETPLIHATCQGHLDTAKYLLDHGADPSVASNIGATALHHAAGIGNTELMKLILSKGVDVESESDAGTPLVWAAGHGNPDAVELLLQHNAKPNTENDDAVTALLSAVAAGSLPCLEVLIEAGANPNVKAGGATPLHIAADSGNIEVSKCLLKAGADPNAYDDDELKPVQVAAWRNNRDTVELLLPLTSPIPGVSEWNVDEIIEHMLPKEYGEKSQSKEAASLKSGRRQTVEVSSEAKKKSLEAKLRGYDAFRRKDYLEVVDAYTQATELDPTDAEVLSNRSLCWLRARQPERALEDAKACRALRPDWAKACYREGAAYRLLQRFEEAANAFYEGVQLEPENKELVSAFREAVEAGRKFHGVDT